MAKQREPFVSGAYRESEDASIRRPRDIAEAARDAHNKRIKNRMARRYTSKGTAHTRKIAMRMLGEKDD